ncbi:MAG: hypothetical protein AAGE80_19465 [Pseudomonadota bacterium]
MSIAASTSRETSTNTDTDTDTDCSSCRRELRKPDDLDASCADLAEPYNGGCDGWSSDFVAARLKIQTTALSCQPGHRSRVFARLHSGGEV